LVEFNKRLVLAIAVNGEVGGVKFVVFIGGIGGVAGIDGILLTAGGAGIGKIGGRLGVV
jgi:hypothetical protein